MKTKYIAFCVEPQHSNLSRLCYPSPRSLFFHASFMCWYSPNISIKTWYRSHHIPQANTSYQTIVRDQRICYMMHSLHNKKNSELVMTMSDWWFEFHSWLLHEFIVCNKKPNLSYVIVCSSNLCDLMFVWMYVIFVWATKWMVSELYIFSNSEEFGCHILRYKKIWQPYLLNTNTIKYIF